MKAAADLRGLKSLTEVARLMDVSTQTLKNWESRGVSRDGMLRAERYIGCPSNWVQTGIGEMHPLVQNVTKAIPRRTVPIVSWVAAGSWHEVEDMYEPGFADDWFDCFDSQPSDNAFALIVEGDSMKNPHPDGLSFPPGTVIVVDPNRAATAGDYVVAKDVATQKATFKKLMHDAGRWFLQPLNPAFPTLEIDDPDIRVIGRVVEYRIGGKL